jgi:hypothetical protein
VSAITGTSGTWAGLMKWEMLDIGKDRKIADGPDRRESRGLSDGLRGQWGLGQGLGGPREIQLSTWPPKLGRTGAVAHSAGHRVLR